jgi:hypothetical protein
MDAKFWGALVRMIAYPELRFDPATNVVTYPSYVPFEQMAREWIEGIEQGLHDVRACEACRGYFEVGREPGIFAHPSEMRGFICMACAEGMTAREFYEKHMQ